MVVKNQRGGQGANKDRLSDLFPVGMRVLAVDDDQVCLKVLEKMLMECRYHVTITTQSTKAIEILREDKNKFDLVISDVNMPNMNGFKLLEIVGLEMDLPVIMLSAHNDINLVKKGILHGACGYLLKPCRMEELQNIWQHVFRKQIGSKELNKASISEENTCNMVREDSQGIASENNADENKIRGKRVIEGDMDEEEDDGENEQEDWERSTRKKPRLLWVNELHRKFVTAVNQLGLERAVPKKILELMNVEGLTRENVASHLQKYRQGLRKAAEQARMTARLGVSNPYLHMPSLDSYPSGSGRFSFTAPPSHVSTGISYNLNSSPSFNLREMSSSTLVWQDQSQAMNGSKQALGSIQPSMFSANQSTNLLQEIPSSIEVNQFQQSNYRAGIRQPRPTKYSCIVTVPSVYKKSRKTFGNGNSYQSCFSSNHFLSQVDSPSPHNNSVAYRNHSPLGAASVKIDSHDGGICSESNKSMPNAVQLSKFNSSLNQPFNNGQLPQNIMNFSSSTSHIGNIPFDFSSRTAIVPFQESRDGIKCQEGLIGRIIQASYNTLQQCCQQHHKHDYNKTQNQTFNSLVSSNGTTSSLGHNSNQNNTNEIKKVDASLDGQQNEATPSTNQCPEPEKLCSDARTKSNDDAFSLQGVECQGVNESDFDPLDYILELGDMVNPDEELGSLFMDEELVFDADRDEACVFFPSEYTTNNPEASKY